MTSKITICICIRLSVQFYYPELSVSGYPANFTIRNYLYPAIWQILLSVHLYKAWLLWLLRLTKKAKSALNHAPCFFTTQVYQNLPIQKSLHHLHGGHGMVVRAIALCVRLVVQTQLTASPTSIFFYLHFSTKTDPILVLKLSRKAKLQLNHTPCFLKTHVYWNQLITLPYLTTTFTTKVQGTLWEIFFIFHL